MIKLFEEKIKEEKNIIIRERTEQKYKRLTEIILVILLTGNYFAGLKNLYSILIMSLFVVISLIFFIFVEIYFLTRYSDYTDELIRKSSGKK